MKSSSSIMTKINARLDAIRASELICPSDIASDTKAGDVIFGVISDDLKPMCILYTQVEREIDATTSSLSDQLSKIEPRDSVFEVFKKILDGEIDSDFIDAGLKLEQELDELAALRTVIDVIFANDMTQAFPAIKQHRSFAIFDDWTVGVRAKRKPNIVSLFGTSLGDLLNVFRAPQQQAA